MAVPTLPSEVDILKTDAAAKKAFGVKGSGTETIWPKPQFGKAMKIDNITDADKASGFVVPAGSMFVLGAAIPASTVLTHGMYFPAGTMFPNGVLVPIHQRMVSCQPLETKKPGPKPAEPACCIQ